MRYKFSGKRSQTYINSESIRRHTMFEQCVACENNISLLSNLLYSKYSVTLKKNRRSPRKINSNSITYHRCSCNHSLQGNTPVFSVVKVQNTTNKHKIRDLQITHSRAFNLPQSGSHFLLADWQNTSIYTLRIPFPMRTVRHCLA